MKIRFFLLLFLISTIFVRAYSQENTISIFDKIYDSVFINPNSTLDFYTTEIKSETSAQKQNLKALAFDYLAIARCLYELKKYDEVYPNLRKSLDNAYRSGNIEILVKSQSSVSDFFRISSEQKLPLTLSKRDNATTKNFNFRIKSIVNSKNDSVWISIPFGQIIGIEKGIKGKVYSADNDQEPTRSNIYLGKAEIVAVDLYETTVLILVENSKDPKNMIREGDLVGIPIPYTTKSYKSVFFRFTQKNIEFLDRYDVPFYPIGQLLQVDDQEMENIQLRLMSYDCRKVAEFIRPKIPENPQWDLELKHGKYAGKKMVDILDGTSPEDLMTFFDFMSSFPGRYLGKSWKISEIFATWLINNAPLGEEKMRTMIFSANTEKELDTVFSQYRDDIQSLEMFDKILSCADDSAKAGKFDNAFKINKVLFKMASSFNNKPWEGQANFNKAYIYDIQDKKPEALIEYEKAAQLFIENRNISGHAAASGNMAIIYRSMKKYNEAFAKYQACHSSRLQLYERNKSEGNTINLVKSLINEAKCMVNLEKKGEALGVYESSLQYLTDSTSKEIIDYRGDIYTYMGKIKHDLGLPAEARTLYENALSLKQLAGKQADEASLLDNIALISDNTSEQIQLYQKSFIIKESLGNQSEAAFTMSNIGQAYWRMKEFQKAIEAHQQAITLYSEINDLSGQAFSYTRLGWIYQKSGEPAKAFDSFDKALNIYLNLSDSGKAAEVYNNLGDLFQNVKQHEKALYNYNEALKIYEKVNSPKELASTYSNKAGVYYKFKEYAKARELQQKALDLQLACGDKEGSMFTYLFLGLISYYYEFKPDSALVFYKKAAEIAALLGNPSDMAFCQKYVADLVGSLGNIEKSISLYGEILKVYRELNDKFSAAEALIQLGLLNFSKGDFDVANSYYNQAEEITKTNNDNSNLHRVFICQSELSLYEGDYKSAVFLANKALDLSKQLENNWGMASANLELGNVYSEMGDYKTALPFLIEADSIYKTLDSETSEATPINNIGNLYMAQGDYDIALPYFQKAHELIEKSGLDRTFLALIKGNIGEVYYETNNNEEAKKWIKDTYQIASDLKSYRQISQALLIQVKLDLESKQLEDAHRNLEELFKVLVRVPEKPRLIEANWLMGKYYLANKDFVNAEKYLKISVSTAEQIGNTKYLWEPLFSLSKLQRETGKTDSAINTLKKSINIIEIIKSKVSGGEEAKKLFASGSSKIMVYSDIVELLMQQGRVDEAIQYLERGNNENLKTKFKSLNVTFNDTKKNDAISTEKDLKSKLELANDLVFKEKSKPVLEQNEQLIKVLEEIKTVHQTEYISFVNQIVTDEPSLRNYFSKSENPINFRAQKKKIPADMGILLYLISEKNLYIFAGTSDSVTAKVVKINKPEFEKEIRDFYGALKAPSFRANVRGTQMLETENSDSSRMADFKDLSAKLYEQLIKPVENEIKGKTMLAIIPNGALYYIPFQVLGQNTATGFHYLISDYSVFYSNKLSYLFDNLFQKDENPKLMAVGNADKTLPFAEEEVNNLKSIFVNPKILVQGAATKTAVLKNQGGFNILHFATHGILDYNNFENSYLVLAKDPVTGDNGKLRIDEIYGISNLESCEMVTLSACETAVVQENNQGWPITTASAFLEIGVPSVIATLWSVDDKATGILMKKFYENLRTMSKLDALRAAQKSVLAEEKYNHPYYWAPFLLIGNWQ